MAIPKTVNKHTEHSSFREKLVEHLFIGELLKLSWQQGDCRLEVAKPEVDNAGCDVILEVNQVIRHAQLKASHHGSKTQRQKLNLRLTEKPSGCVIWILFDEDSLELGPFLFFGDAAGNPLPDINALKIAKHSKANAAGEKAERPNIRVLNKGDFQTIDTIEELHTKLFSRQQG